MNKIKKLLTVFFTLAFVTQVNSKDAPASFADLAERLMPSVVDISTTTTVTTNTNPFPGFELVTTVVVVEIFTTDGINLSAKSANDAGAS